MATEKIQPGMTVILTEKPSVAREIAQIVGATQKAEGYLHGNGYHITWAYGHLVTPAMPEDYGITALKADQLPILPEKQQLIPRKIKNSKGYKTDPLAAKQLDTIKKLFNPCKEIIVATDAGREGELIFRYIYYYLNCTKPFRRLWISSLTEKAIREGFSNLKDGTLYDNLYKAAEARSRADWMIGINASRALCMTSGEGNNSLGRVQTPVLAMICQRYQENKQYKTTPYYQLLINVAHQDTLFKVQSKEQYFDKKKVDTLYEQQKNYRQATVTNVNVIDMSTPPPLLYDLTTLQKEANTRYGMSADATLQAAQKLYEKKYITYPRTSSRYLPQDVFETVPNLISFLKEYPAFCLYATRLADTPIQPKSVDDKKVTDHHALLITGIMPERLSNSEKAIYEMIAGRILETYSATHIKEKTTLEVSCGKVVYEANSYTIKENGWKAIFKLKDDEQEKELNQQLPPLSTGETLTVRSYNMVQKSTKPKPLFTEASLLAAMESAGIGTPATRSGIIETLIGRDYITRDKKQLIPTNKGMFIYRSIKDMDISNVLLTASWEERLAHIEQEPELYNTFIQETEEFTAKITDEILSIRLPKENDSFPCPKCKTGMILFYHRSVRCKNPECDLHINKQIRGITLTTDQLKALLQKRRIPFIKGFKSKNGKSFDAALCFDENFKLKFDFDNEKNEPPKTT